MPYARACIHTHVSFAAIFNKIRFLSLRGLWFNRRSCAHLTVKTKYDYTIQQKITFFSNIKTRLVISRSFLDAEFESGCRITLSRYNFEKFAV